jgi:basic membrane protein A
MKNVDVAVYNYLKSGADGSVQASISTLQNGGAGLAPFHEWDSKIPAELKAQIQKANDGIKDSSIKIDLPQGSELSTENRVLCSTMLRFICL